MKRTPGTVIQASDRRYIVGRHGELRVLDYTARPQPSQFIGDTPSVIAPVSSTSPENFSAAVECGSLTDLPPAA